MDNEKLNLIISNPHIVGFKQVRAAILDQNLRCVILAQDTDDALKQTIIELCHKNSTEIIFVKSKSELGKACSIQVSACVVGILN